MRIIAATIVLLMFKFCAKDSPLPCEKWTYYDECQPISAEAICTTTDTLSGPICGTGLIEAQAGKTTLLINDPDKKVIRHYISKF